MGIFAVDGRLARFLNKLGDLIILNILTLICCIPVITAGAAMTALYSNTLKMVRDEEGAVFREYWKAFRENFRQATVLWIGCLAIIVLLGADFWVLRSYGGTYGNVYRGVILAAVVFAGMVIMYLFPVLARFDNTVRNTAKNALLFCLIHIIKSVLMLAVNLAPFLLLTVSMRFVSVLVLVGISGPAYLTSIFYRSVFRDFEQTEDPVPLCGENNVEETGAEK